jgi:hypothetical protein
MAVNRDVIGQVEAWDRSGRTVLDMDSTESPVHGQQGGSAYNGHFETVCYHPLFLFHDHGDCLAEKLRPGNVSSADDWEELLVPEIDASRTKGPRVAFRADAAFARPAIYEALEARGVGYAIRIQANKVLEVEIEDILFRSPGRPSRKPLVRYKSFHYQADSWTTARRIVAKVEHHAGELFPRVGFIVTSLPLPNRAVVRFYNRRGTAEPWIKEGKQAAHWTRLSCHPFRANEVRLQLSVLAYNLGKPLAAAGAAKADRQLVIDQPATAPRQDGWPAGQTRPLLLAAVGGESSDAAAVRCDAPADLGAARGDRLTGRAWPETVGEERTEGGRSVRKSVGSVVPRVTIRAAGRIFRCETDAGRNPDRARSGWCRMRPINGRQIGNVG